MYDFRPVGHLIGWHVIVLGASMLQPFVIDLADGNDNANAFLISAFLTLAAGLAFTLITGQREVRGLSRPQAFLLTVLVWTILPAFGALPFVFGAPGASYTDAFFEAMSGMTTTGSTVFSGLDTAPRGMLLWRALLQWYGGLGIVIVAVVFLPAMRIGGMQFFRAAAFDVSGDVIPQATRVAADLLTVYVGLTVLAMLAYAAAGMSVFDAVCHAMTTMASGGYANYDASFGAFGPAVQYVAVVFMALAAMPFIRFVALMKGHAGPLWRDTQVRAYLGIIGVAATVLALARLETDPAAPLEETFRAAVFNVTSVLTTTGYASTDYSLWGGLASILIYVVSLTGGCTGSTTGAAKVFRWQVLFAALVVQIRRIHNPHGVFPLRYQGRPVEPEVVSSIMAFFFVYVCTLSIIAILLALLGLDFITAISAPIATVTNVGPGLGPVIGPAGNFAPLPDLAKWVLAFGMLLGRLEFLSVLVLFLPVFWQR
jgi:trk system potassium uptake protein TrkH